MFKKDFLRMKGRPFVFTLVFMSLGIIIAYSLNMKLSIGMLILLITVSLISGGTFKKGFLCFLALGLFILGIMLYQLQFPEAKSLETVFKEDNLVVAKVLREPIKKSYYWQLDIRIRELRFRDAAVEVNEKARLLIYDNDNTKPATGGDGLLLKNISSYEYIEGYRPEGYQLYLKANGIGHIIGIRPNAYEGITVASFNPLRRSLQLKATAEEILDNTLGFNQAALIKSMIFGNQGYLSDEILSSFSKTGTAHVIAISGLHVGIIILILGRALAFFGVNKNYSHIISFIILLLYGYIVAFPVSIVRAIAMFSILILGYFLQRPYDSINGLAAIAFIILLFNPIALFSVSFQLSFAATLGIIVLYPKLKSLISFLPSYLSGLLAVTISAQLATIPIIAYHFNQVSIIAWLVNLLIIPLMTAILGLAIISIFVGIINMAAAALINTITNLLLSYILWTVDFFSSFTYSSIEISSFNIIVSSVYYLLIIGIYHLLNYKNYRGQITNDLSRSHKAN